MMIFDAHLDMAWNAIEWNRNLEWPVSRIREFESQFTGINPGPATVSWDALRKGGVGMTISTLLPRLHRKDKVLSHYQSREAAYGCARGQLAYYRAMAAKGILREIPDRITLQAHVKQWEADKTGNLPIGFIVSMEGSTPILSARQIPEWFEAGLRILGPSHYGPSPYSNGTGTPGGLLPDGPALLREMDEVGMILDVTHLADQSFWEALEIFNGPVLASHHNCRALVPGDRQLDDDQIKALISRGAVIGAAFDAWMLTPGWVIGVTKPDNTGLEKVVDHIDHICQIAGNAKHCGMGTDLDGGFGKEQTPHDLDTIADLHKVATLLESRGYSKEDVDGIMSKNWVDFFVRAWK
ncbi:MAG: membrane dipeptidase [Planctomycetales bacterium]|nr:membrane dipeptidase [Planctomycetales bacterium]